MAVVKEGLRLYGTSIEEAVAVVLTSNDARMLLEASMSETISFSEMLLITYTNT